MHDHWIVWRRVATWNKSREKMLGCCAAFNPRYIFLPGVREDAERIQDLVRNDPKKILSYVFLDFPGTRTLRSKDEYLEKIKTFLVDCKKHGAMIWYAGHGEKGTGNWCFRDGKITFEDILNLYGKYFFGRLLYIITDCCYSGSWVDKLAKKMDAMGIGACGHEAKKRGFFLKIGAACRSDQKAYDALYTKEAVSVGDDGIMQFSLGKKLHTTQTTMFLDTTSMRCFHGPSRECLLHNLEPAQHWKWADLVTPEKISRLQDRFRIVRGFVSDRRVWRIVFVHDNLYDQFMQTIESGSIDVARYAHILASGAGNDPPEDMLEFMTSYRPNH